MRNTIGLLGCVLAFAACSASSDGSDFDDGSSGSEASGSGAAGVGGGEGGIGVGAGGPTGGGPGDDECKNVDVLFVIDNSASMADNQQSVIASFPGFVAGIEEKLGSAPSFHVGVVSVGDHYANPAGCTAIGSLVTQNSGAQSSNAVCTPFASGRSFLDQNEPDLGAKFACIGQVGATGPDDERPIRAMLDALSPAMNGPGGCNEGFSRKDALLVIVLITDEDDVADGCDQSTGVCMTYGSGGTKDEWFAELVSYKDGIANNIVVLSLLGLKLDNSCGAVPASKLIGFTNLFDDNGYKGDVCSTSYDAFFSEVLPVIDKACAEFEPPK